MDSGRIVGIGALVLAVLIGILSIVYLVVNTTTAGLSIGGALLGGALVLLFLVAPLAVVGLLIFNQSRASAGQQAQAEQQRELLNIIRSRGQVDITDLTLEMQVSQERLHDLVYQLVGLQVFSGYINWDKGVLYSAEARQLRDLDKCENCGGEIELSGKGVVTCRFCGTEYFLS